MKKQIYISVDIDTWTKLKEHNLNISAICRKGMREALKDLGLNKPKRDLNEEWNDLLKEFKQYPQEQALNVYKKEKYLSGMVGRANIPQNEAVRFLARVVQILKKENTPTPPKEKEAV